LCMADIGLSPQGASRAQCRPRRLQSRLKRSTRIAACIDLCVNIWDPRCQSRRNRRRQRRPMLPDPRCRSSCRPALISKTPTEEVPTDLSTTRSGPPPCLAFTSTARLASALRSWPGRAPGDAGWPLGEPAPTRMGRGRVGGWWCPVRSGAVVAVQLGAVVVVAGAVWGPWDGSRRAVSQQGSSHGRGPVSPRQGCRRRRTPPPRTSARACSSPCRPVSPRSGPARSRPWPRHARRGTGDHSGPQRLATNDAPTGCPHMATVTRAPAHHRRSP
jgi:hypothetical protein